MQQTTTSENQTRSRDGTRWEVDEEIVVSTGANRGQVVLSVCLLWNGMGWL